MAACHFLGLGKSAEEITAEYQGTWSANGVEKPLSGFNAAPSSAIIIENDQAIIWFGNEEREFAFSNNGTASEFAPQDDGNAYRGELQVGHLAISDGTGTVIIYEKVESSKASSNQENADSESSGGGAGIFGLGVKPFNEAG